LTRYIGDRTSIHSIPNSNSLEVSKLEKFLLDKDVLQYKELLNHFNLNIIKKDGQGNILQCVNDSSVDYIKLSNALNNHLFEVPDFELEPGLLTSRGFMQQIRLGILKDNYLKEYTVNDRMK
jgi:hypothetical protein